MAIPTEFRARIQLRYATYADWIANDEILLTGELAVVYVPANTGVVAQEPAILFKAGDGITTFSNLPYVYAPAADVYDWAKSSTVPSYSVDDIDGLQSAIESIVGEIPSDSGATTVIQYIEALNSSSQQDIIDSLATVASTGEFSDLEQNEEAYVTFYCGDSTEW